MPVFPPLSSLTNAGGPAILCSIRHIVPQVNFCNHKENLGVVRYDNCMTPAGKGKAKGSWGVSALFSSEERPKKQSSVTWGAGRVWQLGQQLSSFIFEDAHGVPAR